MTMLCSRHSDLGATNGGVHDRRVAVLWQFDILALCLHLGLDDDVWVPRKHLGVRNFLEKLWEPIDGHGWHQAHLKIDLAHGGLLHEKAVEAEVIALHTRLV